MTDRGGIAFLRIAEGFDGHTTLPGLFCHDIQGAGGTRAECAPPETGPGSSLHQIALSLPRDEHDAVIAWHRKPGLDHHIERFDWIGWRGVFTTNPYGNTGEIVAKDPHWIAPAGTIADEDCRRIAPGAPFLGRVIVNPHPNAIREDTLYPADHMPWTGSDIGGPSDDLAYPCKADRLLKVHGERTEC